MKHRDFHAGQSALGLMTRNTEAMLAPRMAQWEAFGKGLQDANAIIQNRHAFNEQLAQNRINNEFKNKEFGFREKEAEESKRRFDAQMQENQRQFDQRHALDKQNSSYENKYKESATAYNYWRMGEEQDEGKRQITLKSKSLMDEIAKDMAYLDLSEKAIEKGKEIRENNFTFGFNRIGHDWSGGIIPISAERSEYIGLMNSLKENYNDRFFGKSRSEYKDKQTNNRLDKPFTNTEESSIAVAQAALDVLKKTEEKFKSYRENRFLPTSELDEKEARVKKKRAYFESLVKGYKEPEKQVTRILAPEELIK
ncbi:MULTISPECIES: hypothetical protein [Helicobacter]|uniref:hypothetical protein n=1 Tax=Helicobacter TaxID=209 RepID=UPI00261DF78A|nr:hypothetical protein [Helicobacter sp. UBA3407]